MLYSSFLGMNACGARRAYVTAAWIIALLLVGCGPSDPFRYVNVSGKVGYEDGSRIDANRVTLIFYPQADPIDAKTHPRPGSAEVNVADGTFNLVTSHNYGDGLIAGKHKVVLIARDKEQRQLDVVLSEYTNPDLTPLMVDTADAPFDLKVKRSR